MRFVFLKSCSCRFLLRSIILLPDKNGYGVSIDLTKHRRIICLIWKIALDLVYNFAIQGHSRTIYLEPTLHRI